MNEKSWCETCRELGGKIFPEPTSYQDYCCESSLELPWEFGCRKKRLLARCLVRYLLGKGCLAAKRLAGCQQDSWWDSFLAESQQNFCQVQVTFLQRTFLTVTNNVEKKYCLSFYQYPQQLTMFPCVMWSCQWTLKYCAFKATLIYYLTGMLRNHGKCTTENRKILGINLFVVLLNGE